MVGVILTGIGKDGTAGAKKIVEAGGMMMSQDEETSTVFGMPGSVIRARLAAVIGPPAELARALSSRTSAPPRAGRKLDR